MKDRTKYFDYKFYRVEQDVKIFILILIAFLLGILSGYFCKSTEYEEKINRQAIEIVDLKDQLDKERYYKALKEEKQ